MEIPDFFFERSFWEDQSFRKAVLLLKTNSSAPTHGGGGFTSALVVGEKGEWELILDSNLVLFDGSSDLAIGDTDSNEIPWNALSGFGKTIKDIVPGGNEPVWYAQPLVFYIVATKDIPGIINFTVKGYNGSKWESVYMGVNYASPKAGTVFDIKWTPFRRFDKLKVTCSVASAAGGRIKGHITLYQQTAGEV